MINCTCSFADVAGTNSLCSFAFAKLQAKAVKVNVKEKAEAFATTKS